MVYLYSVLCCLFLFPYFGWRGGQALGPKGRRILWGILALIFVLFILALFTHRSIQADWMSHVMNASVYIFFSSMYAAGVLVLMEVLRYIDRRAFGFYTYAPLWKRKLMRQASLVLAAIVFVGTLFVGYHNVRYPVVLHQDLYLKRLTPEGAKAEKRLRLVFFSDLHIGEAMTPPYVERAVELIMAQHPDLILCGGDYIDHLSAYAYDPRVMKVMRRLRAPLGVYFVLGNHEYRADTLSNIRFVREIGATLLRDSIAYPGDSLLTLIGRDDAVYGDRMPYARITAGVDPTKRPVVLMEHTPGSVDSLAGSPVDLMLCGHTHGGQIWPGQAMVWWKFGIASGTRDYGDKQVCVSSGIGSAGATYRVGTRSEIRVYDLYW